MLNTPLFVKTYDFTIWLLKKTQRFPRNARNNLTKWLEETVGDFMECLLEANHQYGNKRKDALCKADIKLSLIRHWLRAAKDLGYLDINAYGYVSELVKEIGRLLGGWKKIS